ncbi:MAG: ATP-binding protein [Maledivibacter sp.]|nr:ATP-binding protein [Maledivibacter sp.]
MNIKIYIFLLFLATLVSSIITYISYKRKRNKGPKSLPALMMAITHWTLCQLIQIFSTSHNTIFFWHELKHVGIVIVPVAFLSLVGEYTNRKKLHDKRTILLLMIIPVLTLIIMITNGFHGLFRESIQFIKIDNVEIINSKLGVWFWFNAIYSYLLIWAGLILLLVKFINLPKLYRKQARVIIAGTSIPLIWNILYLLFYKDVIYVDITPLAFSLTGIIIFWGLFRYKLLDLVPIARELVFESIEDMVIVLDNNKRIVDMNFSAKKILGHNEFKIIGSSASEILSKLMGLTDRNIEIVDKNIILTYKDEKRYFELRDTQIYDKRNKAIGSLILLHDITEHKRIMEQLRASREKAEAANRAKSNFLANMSHEIRTPMNGVLGMIDLMKSSQIDEEQKANLEIMKNSAHALLTILNDILDYSKVEAGKMELENTDFNVKKMVKDIVKIFSYQASEKNINLSWDIDKEIPDMLVGDPLRLRQIISNLISNSVKFTPNKGCIEATVKGIKKNSEEIVLQFVIKDTGIGIPKEKIKNLFNSFEQIDSSRTRKYGGTGLGLAIVKRLVELMKGSIKVESELNKGSKFSINIPFHTSDQYIKTKEKVKVPIINGMKDINILLAEDNKVNQLIMKKMFVKRGWEVTIAEDGQMVLQELENKNFDIIFMDIQMPILDGYETTIEIRKKGISTPIIALTANAMEEDRQKCLNSGMDDFISKPVIYSNIAEIMNKYV